MSSIKDAMAADLSGYSPVSSPPKSAIPQVIVNYPKANVFIRCPLPPFNSNPDTLRQFETGSDAPQIRVWPLPQLSAASTTVISGGTTTSSSSSGSSTTSTSLPIKTATLTTGVIPAGGFFSGTISLAKSFQLVSITANSACEVRLYGSSLIQSFDSARLPDAPVPAEITSNIITDVIFDTSPFTWSWQNRIGANQDASQTTNAYISIFNTGVAALASVQVFISYIGLET
jgi:hypothetical protein